MPICTSIHTKYGKKVLSSIESFWVEIHIIYVQHIVSDENLEEIIHRMVDD